MTLTKEAEYALLFCLYLSRAGRATVKTASENLGLSKTFLDQVARKLRLSSMVTSNRGPGGGFQLISTETTVYDIINALDIDFNLINPDNFDRMTQGPIELRSLAVYTKWYGMNAYRMLDMKLTSVVSNVVRQELVLMDSASDKGVIQ